MDILSICFLIAGIVTGINGLLITSLSISGFCCLVLLLASANETDKKKTWSNALSILLNAAIICMSIIFMNIGF